MESRLDRIIQLAEGVLGRLDRGERLSSVLPKARLLAEMSGDSVEATWLAMEIYGPEAIPCSSEPTPTSVEQEASRIFEQLHRFNPPDTPPQRGKRADDARRIDERLNVSIGVLEHLSVTELPELKRDPMAARRAQLEALQLALEIERLLNAVRAAVYRYVGIVWQNSVAEHDNQSLLGPDYRIVLNNLDALETGVGQELGAVLPNLRETNPASWSLAAIGCRTVITKLGNLLWKIPGKTYYSNLGKKQLDVTARNEKNRLYAYIDWHHQNAKEQTDKDTLKHLHGKVWPIYDIGSKGKAGTAVRHEEAKSVVVDTFEFVSKLDAITELIPLEAI